jgi:tripartite-type tricarboxylate transporter receptor subunit TctC
MMDGGRICIRRIARAAVGLCTFGLCVLGIIGTAQADDGFYKDKRITLIVSNATGGINDTVARLVARHIGQYIPGNPTVVVQNMPGAGGISAANHLYNIAPKDGSVIGALTRATPQYAILGDPNARFDPLKFIWLGSTSSYAEDTYLFITNSSHPVKSPADLKNGAVTTKIGTQSSGATNLLYALIMKNVLGYNVDIIRGYPGGAAIFVAMQRHEVDAQFAGLSTLLSGQRQLWDSKAVRPIVQFGRTSRLSSLPDVPIGRELTDNPDDRALLEFADLPFFMAQPFLAPPGIPPERAKVLQDAFLAAHKDKAFLAEAERLGVDVSPIGGEQVAALLKRAAGTSRDVIERYKKAVH